MKNPKVNAKLVIILSFLSILPAIHFILIHHYSLQFKITTLNLLLIYGIIGFLTIAHLLSIKPMLRKWPKQAGFLVAGLNLLKMLISLTLLMAILFPLAGKNSGTALNFTYVYFYFLIIESIILVKFLIPGVFNPIQKK
jgi:hypothetical protein